MNDHHINRPAIDLQRFCAQSDDERVHLAKPFLHRGYRYATNGHILVRVPAPEHPDAIVANEKLAQRLPALIDDMPQKAFMALPAFDAGKPCEYCKGARQTCQTRCDACDGEGSFEHDDFDYDCKSCDTSGWLESDDGDGQMRACQACRGGVYSHDPVAVGDAHYSAAYLMWIKDLPGLLVASNAQRGLHFSFDGGDGLLMPIKP